MKKKNNFGKLSKKFKIVLYVEMVICLIFLIRCFLPCHEFNFKGSDFKPSNKDITLTEFKDDFVGTTNLDYRRFELMIKNVKLKSGAYRVNVEYKSQSNNSEKSVDNSAGCLKFSTNNSSVLKSNDLKLSDTQNKAETTFWLRLGSGTKNVKIALESEGNGKIALNNINIKESRSYRFVILFGFMLFFTAVNLAYMVFVSEKPVFAVKQETRYVILGIMGITIFSSLLFMADYIYYGWDLNFHLRRITSLAEALKEHQIPNRIQFHMLNGYGYASPLYYGELFLVIPALLYCLCVPLQACYQITVILINILTAVVCYWCCKKISGDWKKSLFCSALYTLSAYRFYNLAGRVGVGELITLIFMPLLVYGLCNLYGKGAKDKIRFCDYLPIVLAATGIMQSHLLTCEMILIFAVPIVFCNHKTYQKNIFISFLKSIGLILLLNLWYIIPFLQSMRMDVKVNEFENVQGIEYAGLSLMQMFSIYHPEPKSTFEVTLGLSFICIIILFIMVYIKKTEWNLKTDNNMKKAKFFIITGLIAVFISTKLFKWDNIKGLHFLTKIQFPWRYLTIASVLLTFAALFIFMALEKKVSSKSINIIMICICGTIILSEGFYLTQFRINSDEIFGIGTRTYYTTDDIKSDSIGQGEYLIKNTNTDDFKSNEVLTGDNVEDVDFKYLSKGVYSLNCKNTSDKESYADVPVQKYDNYHAYRMDNGEELEISSGDKSRTRISVPGNYNGEIKLKYVEPKLWRVCEIISLISAIALILYGIFGKKMKSDNKNTNQVEVKENNA